MSIIEARGWKAVFTSSSPDIPPGRRHTLPVIFWRELEDGSIEGLVPNSDKHAEEFASVHTVRHAGRLHHEQFEFFRYEPSDEACSVVPAEPGWFVEIRGDEWVPDVEWTPIIAWRIHHLDKRLEAVALPMKPGGETVHSAGDYGGSHVHMFDFDTGDGPPFITDRTRITFIHDPDRDRNPGRRSEPTEERT